MRRIGVLMGSAEEEPGETYIAAFFARLEESGWTNVTISVQTCAGGMADRNKCGLLLLATCWRLPEVIMVFTNSRACCSKPYQ